uniref:ORF2 n=1 Tax=Giant panda anellovirus TaxID=2016460 RepID=A0A220IGK2_9VIRU|nr:ORF2 [Giant panda anellovirus]
MPPKIDPLSFHGRAKAEWNKKQAIWFKACSVSHMLFCNCGDWITHLQRYQLRQQQCHIEDVIPGGAGDISFVTEDGDVLTDTGGERGRDTTTDVG